MGSVWTYILKCANGAYYVGHSRCLPGRVVRHNAGEGSQFTAAHLPAKLAYSEEFGTEREAVRRERQIKKWSRAKKIALIEGDLDRLRQLSKSRDD